MKITKDYVIRQIQNGIKGISQSCSQVISTLSDKEARETSWNRFTEAVRPKHSTISGQLLKGSFISLVATVLGFIYNILFILAEFLLNLLRSCLMIIVAVVVTVMGYVSHWEKTTGTIENWSIKTMNGLRERLEKLFKRYEDDTLI